MTDTALLAVLLAAIAGVVAGRAWASALRRGEERDRASFRTSAHYIQGLHYLAAGHLELAISELSKVAREQPDAVEVAHVLGNLLREAGQVERAIQAHQSLLARSDLGRAERAHLLSSLGTDFRKAGFLDRATRAFGDALAVDARNIHALVGMQKLQEDQRQWRDAYETQTRLGRLGKTDDSLVLGYLQTEMGREAARAGNREAAERGFRTALSLDRRVFPAHLGLADLWMEGDPRKAAAILEDAVQAAPDRAYLAFDRLSRCYAAAGEPSRFVSLCERIIGQDARDWRARLNLARHLRGEGRLEEAHGLLLRALETNPHVMLVHLEMWRTLRGLGLPVPPALAYVDPAEGSVFYRDPHICTVCRYRADDMLWRCPHCHEWNTFVEERLGPGPSGGR
ncbi:MAG TPA: tetratricopeptide repeat protein [Vicinamibacteria bacterium]|nr:tetratricopeptide repeat protein [Vicinamibacteria bacterium]